jgi:hypothetical protein
MDHVLTIVDMSPIAEAKTAVSKIGSKLPDKAAVIVSSSSGGNRTCKMADSHGDSAGTKVSVLAGEGRRSHACPVVRLWSPEEASSLGH